MWTVSHLPPESNRGRPAAVDVGLDVDAEGVSPSIHTNGSAAEAGVNPRRAERKIVLASQRRMLRACAFMMKSLGRLLQVSPMLTELLADFL